MAEHTGIAGRANALRLALGSFVGLVVVVGGTAAAVGQGMAPESIGSVVSLVAAGGAFLLLYLVSGGRPVVSGLVAVLPCLLLFVSPLLGLDRGTATAVIVAVVSSALVAVGVLVLAGVHRRGGTRDDSSPGQGFTG